MKTTRNSDDRFRNSGADEMKEHAIERSRSRDSGREERPCAVVVVDREPGRTDDDEMFRPFDL